MENKYKLTHFNTRENFDNKVLNPFEYNGFWNDLVFIKDTKEIYTHGEFYSCQPKEEDTNNTCHKKLIETTESTIELQPNTYYRVTNTSLSLLQFTLATPVDETILNEYLVEFTTSDTGTTIGFPSVIKWANGEVPEFSTNSTYQVSIVNNLGVVLKFA